MDWHSQSIWHKGLPQKWEKAAYSFECELHGVELYLTNELSYQELLLQAGAGGSSAIIRWGTDVSEKIHQEKHSRNSWIFEIHIDVLTEALLTVKIRIQKACKRAGQFVREIRRIVIAMYYG